MGGAKPCGPKGARPRPRNTSSRSTRAPRRRAPCSFDAGGQASSMRCQHPFAQLLPASRAGWSTTRWISCRPSSGALAELTVSHGLAARRHRQPSASRTSARPRSCGTARRAGRWRNAIVWQCRRTAPIVEELCRRPGRRASHRGQDGPRARRVLLGQQGQVDPRQRARRPRGRRGGKARVRHGGQLARLVAHARARCTPPTSRTRAAPCSTTSTRCAGTRGCSTCSAYPPRCFPRCAPRRATSA